MVPFNCGEHGRWISNNTQFRHIWAVYHQKNIHVFWVHRFPSLCCCVPQLRVCLYFTPSHTRDVTVLIYLAGFILRCSSIRWMIVFFYDCWMCSSEVGTLFSFQFSVLFAPSFYFILSFFCLPYSHPGDSIICYKCFDSVRDSNSILSSTWIPIWKHLSTKLVCLNLRERVCVWDLTNCNKTALWRGYIWWPSDS